MKAENEMRKALKCLYLEAPTSVCEDIELKFNAYRDSIIKEIDDMIGRFGSDSLVFKVLTELKKEIKK